MSMTFGFAGILTALGLATAGLAADGGAGVPALRPVQLNLEAEWKADFDELQGMVDLYARAAKAEAPAADKTETKKKAPPDDPSQLYRKRLSSLSVPRPIRSRSRAWCSPCWTSTAWTATCRRKR